MSTLSGRYIFSNAKSAAKGNDAHFINAYGPLICRKCRKNQVNENQLAMFEPLKQNDTAFAETMKKHDEAIIKATTAKL